MIRSLLLVLLLVASARYSFVLGKSYITESVKSSDRAHAASFGRFYVKAYGEKATWSEIKEVFQHWNVSGVSAFSSIDPESFDPKILNAVTEMVRSVREISGVRSPEKSLRVEEVRAKESKA